MSIRDGFSLAVEVSVVRGIEVWGVGKAKALGSRKENKRREKMYRTKYYNAIWKTVISRRTYICFL